MHEEGTAGELGEAQAIFAKHLIHAHGAEDVEALCAEHPRLADSLRELAAHWLEVTEVVRALGEHTRFSERLKRVHEDAVDPQISLHDIEGEARKPSKELLDELASESSSERYRLIGEIARGGMGAIFEVFDTDLHRKLAMKVILSTGEGANAADEERSLGRFLEEAQITGQLDHTGIVPVHELGLDSAGRVFFTMRLVKGRDLRHIFELVRTKKEGWTQTRALGVLQKVCEAMAYAHSKGVIHRDLKPGNVMVGRFGEVYVMDWGLAKVIGRTDTHDLRLEPTVSRSLTVKTTRKDEIADDPDALLVTMDGTVVGTPAYMPPEQARGEMEELDRRSDVYSLGAMLYQLLSGAMPYVPLGMRPSGHAIWRWVLEGPPRPVHQLNPHVPAELAAICEKAMAREPQERYADTLELGEDLRAYLEGRVVRAYRTGAVTEFRKWVGRNKGMAAALFAAFVILTAGLAVSLVFKERSDRTAELAAERKDRALVTESLFLADLALQRCEAGDVGTGLQLALEALPKDLDDPDRPYIPQAQVALHHAVTEMRELAVLEGHTSAVLRVSFSPDGRHFVTCGDDTPRVWTIGGEEFALLTGHSSLVDSAEFNPRGDRIVTASADGTARLWTIGGLEIAVMDHEGGPFVMQASFSPDGRRIHTVTGKGEAKLRTWSSEGELISVRESEGGGLSGLSQSPTGDHMVTWWTAPSETLLLDGDGRTIGPLHEGKPVRHAAFSPDGRLVATAGYDQTARIWDAQGTQVAALEGHSAWLTHVAFSSDGSRLLTSSGDDTARIWSLEGKELAVLHGHRDSVRHAEFSPDGTRIVTASEDGTARLWTTEGRHFATLGSHKGELLHAAFSPDGRVVATCSKDGTVRVWDAVKDRVPVLRSGHTYQLTHASFSPDGSRILTSASDARLWDREGRELFVLQREGKRDESASFSPDGKRILTCSSDGTAALWDLEGRVLSILRGHREKYLTNGFFSPDGSRIVTTGLDGARIWDDDGLQQAVLRGHTDYVAHAVFSPDGTRVVTASHDGTARLWDVAGRELAVLRGHTDDVYSVAFSPDGALIATTSSDGTARLWDADGGEVAVLSETRLGNVQFSPDGSLLATCGNPPARLWDREGREVAVLRGHEGYVAHVAFSADGQLLVTASADGTARIWDVEGRELAVLRGSGNGASTDYGDGLVKAVFSPDGRHVLAACNIADVRLFPVISLRELFERARSMAPGELTPEQRRAFFLTSDVEERP